MSGGRILNTIVSSIIRYDCPVVMNREKMDKIIKNDIRSVKINVDTCALYVILIV